MKASVGYPDHEATIAVLNDAKTRDRAKPLSPVIAGHVIVEMSKLAHEVYVDPAILGYVSRSPRSRAGTPREARPVGAWLPRLRPVRQDVGRQPGSHHVVPDDIEVLAEPVLCHRLLLNAEAQFAGTTVEQCVDQILGDIAPPAERASA